MRGVLVLVALVLAGCLSAPGPATLQPDRAAALPLGWYAKALAHGPDHNHTRVEEHMGASTPNFHLLGHDPLLTDHFDGKPAFGYGCGGIGTTSEGRRLDVVSAFQNEFSFVLVDVTDPTRPTKVGEFYSQGMPTYDADLTPDGRFVVLAFDAATRTPGGLPDGVPGALDGGSAPVSPPPDAAPALGFRNACGEDLRLDMPDVAASQGIVLVDVRDPSHPVYADWDPTPGRNLHSVSTALLDGTTWVIGSVLGGFGRPGPLGAVPVSLGFHALSYFAFDQVLDTPLGPKLVRISTFDPPPVVLGGDPALTVPIRNGHTDAVLVKHPGTGQPTAYLADWEGGVVVVDLSVPVLPRFLAAWVPPHPLELYPNGDGPCYRSAIHEVLPAPELWEGKHYLFAGQECPSKQDETAPGGSVFVLDDTDPSNLQLVGSWHLPADTGKWTVAYQASPHYLALVNRTLFVADYHAGIWAVDVSGDLQAPPSIGVYMPAIPPPIAPDHNDTLPFDEQVDAFPDGVLVVNEDTTGLYVLRFDASDPAPPAPPFAYG